MTEYKTDADWGVCPICGDSDGYLNAYKDRWFICHEHKVRWCVGTNLFSSWIGESESGWRDNLNRIGPYRDPDDEEDRMHPRARAEIRARRIDDDRAALGVNQNFHWFLVRSLGLRLRLTARIVADLVLTAVDATGGLSARLGANGAAFLLPTVVNKE